MFKTNTYFDTNIVSIAFKNEEDSATVGVMAKGAYMFGTTSVAYMTVISGEKQVQLPDDEIWTTYKAFETFKVEANQSFNVKVTADTSYKCVYK